MRVAIGVAALAVACLKSEQPPGRATADVVIRSPVAIPSPPRTPASSPLSLERLIALGSTGTQISDPGTPCRSFDSASVAAVDTGLHRPLRNGERFRCVLSRADTVIVALVVDTIGVGYPVVLALRIVDASGDSIPSIRAEELRMGQVVEPPPARTPFLIAQDLDFDGIRELKLMLWWGATGNTGWVFFRRDPATHRMVRDTVLTKVGDPEPLMAADARCVRVSRNGGHAGMVRTISVFCWDGDRLPELFRSTQDWNDSTRCYVRRSFMRKDGSDSLVLVRTVTFPAPGEHR